MENGADRKPEYRLTQVERRQLLALVRDRERVVASANQEISEIQAAMDELAARLAEKAGLWDGQKVFEDGPGDGMVLRIASPMEPMTGDSVPSETMQGR